jgi:large subunit ribosomal protein L10
VATATERESRGTPRKHATVAELTEKLNRATSAVVTDYRGLTVKQVEELRTTLRGEDVDYLVVKNTLARRSAQEAGVAQFQEALTGPVALAIGYGDLSAPARILNEYYRANKRLPIVAGLVEGRVLDANSMRTLAELPSREVLLAQVAGTLQSPISSLASALQSILSNFAATLDAYRAQLAA